MGALEGNRHNMFFGFLVRRRATALGIEAWGNSLEKNCLICFAYNFPVAMRCPFWPFWGYIHVSIERERERERASQYIVWAAAHLNKSLLAAIHSCNVI